MRAAGALMVVWAAGCGGPVEPVLVARSIDVPVDGGDYLFEAAIDPPSLAHVDLSQERELLGRGIALMDIERVTVEELSVYARDDEGGIEWFQSAALRMRAPGQGSQTVAEITEFPEDAARVDWEADDPADVTHLVSGGSTTIWVDLRGDSPPEDTRVRVDFALMVRTR